MFRSDNQEVCRPTHTGVREVRIGELVIEFIYVVGHMDYAVNFRRRGTEEIVRLTDEEWGQLVERAEYVRATAGPVRGLELDIKAVHNGEACDAFGCRWPAYCPKM